MRFGPEPVAGAAGGILGHGVTAGIHRFRKGRVLSAEDVRALQAAGITEIHVARLEPGDVAEDLAASRIAAAACGGGARVAAAFTGRANIYADATGLMAVDPLRIDQINLIDEAITIATLPALEPVEPGQMLATVKIIPFAVAGPLVDAATLAATGAVRVLPFRPQRAGLVQTSNGGIKDSVLAKTEMAMRTRLNRLGSELIESRVVAHGAAEIASAISELRRLDLRPIFVVGESAIVDRRDVVPRGIELAGGVVEHFGMPVDPGNLLLLGRIDDCPVIGAPGCARSPKLNGFDWVLQRLCAGLPPTRADIMRMGTGGLLKEIPTRPMPREAGAPSQGTAPRRPRIAALVLAAGLSSRMAGEHKLLADLEGRPILRHVMEHLLASSARPILVVTGHRAEEIEAAAGPGDFSCIRNPTPEAGLASSLVTGLNGLPPDIDGVLICLGDMPDVNTAVIEGLISAFNPQEGRRICVPVVGTKRGNPVLWSSEYFNKLKLLSGDSGAKSLLQEYADWICEVAAPDTAVLTDIDTAEALAARRIYSKPADV